MGHTFVTESVSAASLRALNYVPELQTTRRKRKATRRLGGLLADMGPGYGAVFRRVDCDRSHGLELITQSDMFAAEPEGRIIRRDSIARPEKHLVKRWQVLISGAGTLGETELYGRSIIADSRLEGRYVGPHAMVLTFEDPASDDALFAYAFLCAPIGIRAVRSTSFGTKILGLRKDLLKELPIPIVSAETARRVADCIRECVKQRESYIRELKAARRIIEQLPEMQAAHASCAARRARAISWTGPIRTLSAWNHASSGDALSLLQRKWSARLRDTLMPNGLFNGPRFARIDCERPHGLDFLSQRDIFLIRPVPRRIARPAISDRMLLVPKQAVLVGSHGQITDGGIFGKVELASFAGHRCGLTQDILRLLFRPEFRAICYTFLSTIVGERLLKATAVGTSIPSMRLDLLMDTPIPEMSRKTSNDILARIDAAEIARIAASDAEAEAVRIIEEEVLPSWRA